MDFGEALGLLKAGQRVARAGWNGKGMWLRLCKGGVANFALSTEEPAHEVLTEAHILMWTAQKTWVPWLASQTDVLAEDWSEVR